ncbi:MAG: type II secretion system minor pseudopilin GspK [Thermodesulfovibrionia bacterium]|nr:type II secretion system minor pseudopilin GspK [Thermodesulfovibrionia bacterium]
MMKSNPNISIKCLNHQNRKGSALVIVLLLVAMITTLVVEFAYEIYTDTSSVANWVDSQRASLIAKSGQAFSSEYLKVVKDKDYTHTKDIALPVPIDFGPDSSLILKAEDENSKFNINKITDAKKLDILKRMLEYLNINTNLAYSIADWIDADSEPMPGGSEDKAKNAPLWSVDELKYIKGIDTETFNKLSPFITVYGDETSKININTASLTVLMSLTPEMTETMANNIISYRESAPFESTSLPENLVPQGVRSELIGKISIKSDYFRIYSIARSHEITRIIESVMDTSLKVHYWREG